MLVVNEVVTRRVCGNHGYDGTSNVDQCCAWEANIQVNSFFYPSSKYNTTIVTTIAAIDENNDTYFLQNE